MNIVDTIRQFTIHQEGYSKELNRKAKQKAARKSRRKAKQKAARKSRRKNRRK
jgi:high-affinity Fe2+/Pb2+ permease